MTGDAVRTFWAEFSAATGVEADYEVFAFGVEGSADPADMTLTDECARLVVGGIKRATSGLLEEYEEEGEPLPLVGDHAVVLDSRANPVAIIRTTSAVVAPFGEVDEEFAYEEGEGDRTLEQWRASHRAFFARIGRPVSATTPLVLERFEKVWPPDGV